MGMGDAITVACAAIAIRVCRILAATMFFTEAGSRVDEKGF
jgi:hypothetical protein